MPKTPDKRCVSTLEHRVSFYETDAMKVVHHSNYIRYFELARVKWLDEFDEPYLRYVERDIHFATTKVHALYRLSARYDDVLDVHTWVDWVRGASLRMSYSIDRDGIALVTGWTEHALVSGEGKVRRIPKENRARFAQASNLEDSGED